MSVAELDRSPSEARPRAARRAFARLGGTTFLGLVLAAVVTVVGAGGYLVRSSDADRLDQQLTALTAQVGESNDLITSATDRVLELSAENQQLAADLDAATDLNEDLAARLARVEAAVQSTSDLDTSVEALVSERDQLRVDLTTLTSGFNAQSARLAELQTIESFGPSASPLLFDDGTEAWVTQPVCTGSMEPTIGCEDLLIVYKPAITDLNIDDIVILRHPGPECKGVVPGVFLLHRITRVVSSGSDGLMIETKGDANPDPDPCRAPISSVTGKVLAVVQNSRLPE